MGRPIVYIDESGFAHDMPRTHGYAMRGQRCFGQNDWNDHMRTNAIGAMLGKFLLTVTLFASTINTDTFFNWIQKDLINKIPKNSVIVMDNASFHKHSKIKLILEQNGHRLEYLPPYSPDLNPIEKKWAQAKKLRRKKLCSIDDLFKNNMAIL